MHIILCSLKVTIVAIEFNTRSLVIVAIVAVDVGVAAMPPESTFLLKWE